MELFTNVYLNIWNWMNSLLGKLGGYSYFWIAFVVSAIMLIIFTLLVGKEQLPVVFSLIVAAFTIGLTWYFIFFGLYLLVQLGLLLSPFVGIYYITVYLRDKYKNGN